MPRWPVERTWNVTLGEQGRAQLTTRTLAKFPVVVLLGAAGLGKTFELAELRAADEVRGCRTRAQRLAELATSPDALDAGLARLAEGADESTALHVDALDEAMILLPSAGLNLGRFVENTLAPARVQLRLACRSAVWPSTTLSRALACLSSRVRDGGVGRSVPLAYLEPLSATDIASVVAVNGFDPNAFLAAASQAGVFSLAQQPITLQMLLSVFRVEGTLPRSRTDLFDRGLSLLARESQERREIGTDGEVGPQLVLEAGERLACYSVLAGCEAVDLGDTPADGGLHWQLLDSLPSAGQAMDEKTLKAIGRSGLCDGTEGSRFGFAHRQYAEYLAGRRIARLPVHQAKALLATPIGWEGGVAGPLRETAAFAAMHNAELATWIAERDPEVIGLSEVAGDGLRRQATLHLLQRFRNHELTDAQVGRDGFKLDGLRYPDAVHDLRPVLRERGAGVDAVLECAIELIESWQLASMSEDLADLTLDPGAPLQARKAAGYALVKFGTDAARRRLRPLIEGSPQDKYEDLKGLALRCNWPHGITAPELLAVLHPPLKSNYFGGYEGFLMNLDRAGFDAVGHRVAGLNWAIAHIRRRSGRGRDHEPTFRIASRIAQGALAELDDPAVLRALAILLLEASDAHTDSPLSPLSRKRSDFTPAEEAPAPHRLSVDVDGRRKLLDALASHAPDYEHVWWSIRETPDLLSIDDFSWLLQRAVDSTVPMPVRVQYAELARMLPWWEHGPCVDAWLTVRTTEPLASRLNMPLFIEVDSEEATTARAHYPKIGSRGRPRVSRKPKPLPKERVAEVLALCETRDPRFFHELCRQLTLREDSTHYGFARFLTTTPGWQSADEPTRKRIISAAERFIEQPTDAPEACLEQPLNSILGGYLQAIFLLHERRPSWLVSRTPAWWSRWAWYLLRELHPNMVDEDNEPKADLLKQLLRYTPKQVQESIIRLAALEDAESLNLLRSLLEMMEQLPDSPLDDQLCEMLATRGVRSDRIGVVAEFVLARTPTEALSVCLGLIDPTRAALPVQDVLSVAVALLNKQLRESWDPIMLLLESKRDLARQVLSRFLHGDDGLRSNQNGDEPRGIWTLSPKRAAQLAALLLEFFPPEKDPEYEGARFIGPDDSARQIRDQLISWLGEQSSEEAVTALEGLERVFGTKYPWLRRPRARAQRAHRLTNWTPIPPRTVAEILLADDKRLIRSSADAVDGIIETVRSYGRSLHRANSAGLEELWNTPRRRSPSPKAEEHVSAKITEAVERYFSKHAVTADREVQVFRRLVPAVLGGPPGDEIDVQVRVPAIGTMSGDPIKIPVEVKFAHNAEARTALRDQLAARYMAHLDSDHGVFVVVFMKAPGRKRKRRPLWKSLAEAQAKLDAQARELATDSAGSKVVRVVVIDASLKTGQDSRRGARAPRRRKAIKKRPARRGKTGSREPGSLRRSKPKRWTKGRRRR